jgi:hypothetical protein
MTQPSAPVEAFAQHPRLAYGRSEVAARMA